VTKITEGEGHALVQAYGRMDAARRALGRRERMAAESLDRLIIAEDDIAAVKGIEGRPSAEELYAEKIACKVHEENVRRMKEARMAFNEQAIRWAEVFLSNDFLKCKSCVNTELRALAEEFTKT